MRNFTIVERAALCAALFLSICASARAAGPPLPAPAVRGVVNDAVVVPLTRSLPGALSASFDQGVVNAAIVFPHVRLALTRPAASQAALDRLTHDQSVRGNPAFHQWLAPTQLRAYGPAQADINQVVNWLNRHGLTVNSVSPSGMSIDFGGTAGRIAAAFHTQLHNVAYSGEAHVSILTPPAVPAALAPVITGVILSNFFPKPALQHVTPSLTEHTSYGTFYAVAPDDFATIYNIHPLRSTNNYFGRPITGDGVTLAVVEDTQLRSTADWQQFRQLFGLSHYGGKLEQTLPGGCTPPGINGDEGEAVIDVEWSTAVAPGAKIVEASCAGSGPLDFGVFDALYGLVEFGTPATIFSVSYEYNEDALGYVFEQVWTNLLEEGAAQGKAIFVAAGDNGVSADRNTISGQGLFVNGLADSAYNVSVGGTDFEDFALDESSTYWNAANTPTGGSVKSYLPEIPWDNSCASPIIATFVKTTPLALCNSSYAAIQNGVGGSGSQSLYYTKPDWQAGVLGVPNDGVRDQPDVSLFAANGIWNHFYVICFTDQSEGGAPGCDYSNQTDFFDNAYGGTSFGSPAFAGIAALIQETYDLSYGKIVPLGNPAPVLYAVAKAQFTTPLGLSGCDSSLGKAINRACAFNYVTAGSNAEPCYAGTPFCYTDALSTKKIGIMRTTVDGKSVFAYPAQPGYSLATGLGTVNVTNLVYNYYIGL